MHEKIRALIIDKLKQIKPGAPIYEDSVMQSKKDFYFVLSIVDNVTENVGINVQNKGYLADIALVDNRKNKKMIKEIIGLCGSFFNVLYLDGETILTEEYQTNETDGVWHVQFLVAFPQQIEWE